MGYYINLEKISCNDFRNKLKSAYLPPSRLILKDNLDEQFDYFTDIGVTNLKALVQLLKNKNKLAELLKHDCFTQEYLKVLLRELNSMHPKPNKIAEFVDIAQNTLDNLTKIGITTTEKLYEKVLNKIDRQKLAEANGIDYHDILKLTKLADLSRIKWVGVTYAQMLYNLGFDTVEKVSEAHPNDLHLKINRLIKENNIFKGTIGINDVRILIESANELSIDIEY